MDDEGNRAGVNRALERLLNWPEIARSPQLARFLSYIVERQLNGDAQSIKAYSIAVDVFGRSPDFDPQADPIVRVQARRLRGLLDQYYRGPGAGEPIRIELPVGRYVPDFVENSDGTGPAEPVSMQDRPKVPDIRAAKPARARPRGHVTISWFVLLVLALGATALTYSLTTLGPRRDQQAVAIGALQKPHLHILEFQNLTGDATITSAVSALAIELVTDFAPLLVVDVSFGGRGEVQSTSGADADYVLSGIVRKDEANAANYQFNAILTEVDTNNIVWNWSVNLPREQIMQRGGVDFISQELITVLGGSRGPLHAKAYALLERSTIDGQENFYLCGVLFSMYRSHYSPGMADRTRKCLDALPPAMQEDGNVLAARASLLAEFAIGSRPDAERQARFEEAAALLARALQAAPTSSFVWEQKARLHEAVGQHEEAEAAYGTALQRNPANIDGLAAHARHMALTGRLADALPPARRAISAVSQTAVPDWFQCVPALAATLDGGHARAAQLAQTCSRADVELGPILSMLIAQDIGDTERVGQLLSQILEVPSFRSAGILTQLRSRITDPGLLERIQTGLIAAGVPAGSLIGPY